jgi:acetyl-CoA carboxylase/biotin carboxylase 1
MHALGDKIGSTIIAQSAGVPTIAWNGDDLKVDYAKTGIPQSVYDQANVVTAEDALACAERIGFPVMIKASEGGGGKGIRKALRSEDVKNLYRRGPGECPGPPRFVFQRAPTAPHLEVQLLADQHGEAIALSGRDCSVQRRHQKIIEEGPPVAAPPAVFRQMEKAAIALAKAVGYSNAGTVEYLYLEESQQFAFLELNPRLQVEHPVTENILQLNLPACQLQVAMGIPLHRIGDVRRMYGRHPRGQDTIDFEFAERVARPHHCIAVRVTAENPEAGFQPTSGDIQELQFHSAIDVWGYFSVNNSGLIHEFADSQFGHIFAGGPDRESARRAMIVALKELQIRGDIRTTVEYIIKMLQSSDFIANRINTDWLDGRIARHKEITAEERSVFCPPATLVATCGAALQGYKQLMQRDESFINMLKVGQVPPKDILSPIVKIDLIFDNVKYKTSCIQSGGENVIVACNHHNQRVSVRTLSDGGYLLNVAGRSHVAYFTEEAGGSVRMILDGHTCMFTPEYDPTKLTSGVAGKIARLLVQDGSHVDAGEAFVEIEVMKMYMPLKALESGTVHFQMSQGATLSPGDVIALVDLDNPESVVTAEEFKGTIVQADVVEDRDAQNDQSTPAHLKQKAALKSLQQVLEGYPLSEKEIRKTMKVFIESLRDPMLPVLNVDVAMSVLRGRIDGDLANTINGLNDQYRAAVKLQQMSQQSNVDVRYPAVQVLQALQTAAQALPVANRPAFFTQTADLWSVVEPYLFSMDEIVISALSSLLESYLSVEKLFDNMSFTDMVNKLRKDHQNELQKVLLLCRSHVNIKAKNALVLAIIEEIKAIPQYHSIKRPDIPLGIAVRNELHTRKIKLYMTELSKLRESTYSHISFAANLLLIDQLKMTSETRAERLDEIIVTALTTGDPIGQGDRVAVLNKFINSNVVFRDVLISSMRRDPDYQIAAIELYLRKIYQKTHNIISMNAGTIYDDTNGTRNCYVTFEFLTNSPDIVADTEVNSPQGGDPSPSSRRHTPSISLTDITECMLRNGVITVRGKRSGVFAVVASPDHLPQMFDKITAKIPNMEHSVHVNAVHIMLMSSPDSDSVSDDQLSTQLAKFLSTQSADLKSRSVRRVSFFIGRTRGGKPVMPLLITFRSRTNFTEDRLFRHIEAPHAFHLDLPRLSNFSITMEEGIQTASGNVHIYKAIPLTGKGSRRFFARLVSFATEIQLSDVESLYVEALDHLSLVLGREETVNKTGNHGKPAANHVFVNVVSLDSVAQPDSYEALLRLLCTKYSHKMIRLGITVVELKFVSRLSSDSEPQFMRLVASNPTGFVLNIDKYTEVNVGARTVYKCINRGNPGPLDGLETTTPYEVSQKFENQRAVAMSASETLYCYDWPLLFESVAERNWVEHLTTQTPRGNRHHSPRNRTPVLAIDNLDHRAHPPTDFFTCTELVICDPDSQQPLHGSWTARDALASSVLLPVKRAPGLNDVGMVAWHVQMSSPECPQGREFVMICNDITFQAGSFGTREDVVFYKVCSKLF